MNNSVLFFFTIAFLFVISLTQTTAQVTCPTGMNGPETTTYNYNNGGTICPITIIYCWSLSPGGVLTTSVEWVGGSIACLNAFLNDANKDMMLMGAITLDLGTNGKGYGGSNPIPPCSTYTAITYVISTTLCNYLENDATNSIMWQKPCSNPGLCRRHYSVCIDFTQSPPVPVTTFISASADPGNTCSETFPTIPSPCPNGWQSGCFMSPCQ